MPYICPSCAKSYTTASHLARHTITHQPARHFQCPFCSKTCVRQDVARRHAGRCPERRGRPVAGPTGRGQPRKACRRCAGKKVKCDGREACGECVRAGARCLYGRELAGSGAGQAPRNDAGSSSDPACRVPFLLGYTAAEAGTPKDFALALGTSEVEVDGDDEPLRSFPVFTPLFVRDMFQVDDVHASDLLDVVSLGSPEFRARGEMLHRRVSDLVTFVEGFGGRHNTQGTIAALLTPQNLSLCVDNFFRHAYRHVPIVHKPSFQIAGAELPLLLSIFVVGAVWSYPRDTYFMVLDVIELAEKCIFESTLYKDLQGCGSKSVVPPSQGVLPLLQAATLMVSISFAFPCAEVRRRFRSRRFSDLMSIIQLLGAEKKGDSRSVEMGSMYPEWTDYIVEESCSRVIYYVYLLDCHISTLFAVLPRMPVLEMQARLPSDEATFGAENADTCRNSLLGAQSAPQMSLVEVVQSLMAVESLRPELFRLTAFPLFLTIEALQTMIFTAKTQLLDASQAVRFERALARWKDIWDHSCSVRSSQNDIGFMVHAEEVWILARKLLKSDASKLIPRFGVNDMAQVRQWLSEID